MPLIVFQHKYSIQLVLIDSKSIIKAMQIAQNNGWYYSTDKNLKAKTLTLFAVLYMM